MVLYKASGMLNMPRKAKLQVTKLKNVIEKNIKKAVAKVKPTKPIKNNKTNLTKRSKRGPPQKGDKDKKSYGAFTLIMGDKLKVLHREAIARGMSSKALLITAMEEYLKNGKGGGVL